VTSTYVASVTTKLYNWPTVVAAFGIAALGATLVAFVLAFVGFIFIMGMFTVSIGAKTAAGPRAVPARG
jgi:hypothetical protein